MGYIDLFQTIDEITPRTLIPDADDASRYGYVPLRASVFVDLLNKSIEFLDHRVGKSHYSFLDIGAGLGDKVAMAALHQRIEKAHGIEYQAKHNFPRSSCVKFVSYDTDAFTFTDYAYDIIYTYCPLKDSDSMISLLNLILSKMPATSCLVFKSVPDFFEQAKERLYSHTIYSERYALWLSK